MSRFHPNTCVIESLFPVYGPEQVTSGATSDLRNLAQIILDNVDIVDNIYKQSNLTHPSIGDIYDPGNPAEQLALTPEVLSASLLAVSAASQLVATLKLPGMTLLDRANAVSG